MTLWEARESVWARKRNEKLLTFYNTSIIEREEKRETGDLWGFVESG